MANFLLVEVDDFSTVLRPISDEDLAIIRPLIEKIRAWKDCDNFPVSDGDNETVYEMYAEVDVDGNVIDSAESEAIDTFWEYLPSTPNGFSAVTNVEVYDVQHIEGLYRVS